MNYNIIDSGSSGNALLFENGILIDIGVSFKKLAPFVKNIKVVLLTHRHGDHFLKSTVVKLATERPTIVFIGNKDMQNQYNELGLKNKFYLIESHYSLNFGLFSVSCFDLVHDVQNIGYLIKTSDKRIFYATDTKYIPVDIEADLYFIEGNYKESEIQDKIDEKIINGQYIYEYRVLETHMSEEKAIDYVVRNNIDAEYVLMHQHVER